MDQEVSPEQAIVLSNARNRPATVATASVIIGFGIGRTFIFYDRSAKVSGSWAKVFDKQTGWTFTQFVDYKKPLGWIARLSMNECASLDESGVPEDQRTIPTLAKRFEESFGATLTSESLEAIFFTPGVGVLRMQLSFAEGQDVAWRLNDLNDWAKRKPIRSLLHKLVECAVKSYTDCLEDALEKPESPIKPFSAVDQNKHGYPAFFVVSFVDQSTFDKRTRTIRDLLAITDEQKRSFDERARVGYDKATVFVDWSEALVSGSSGLEQQQQIETNFIIAMASWSSLSLMERHSSSDIFDAFAQTAGVKTKRFSVNDIYIRSMAYHDVSDASLPIRWTANSRDLHLLEAIHRNWSSERLRQVIRERMQALSLHHQRIQNEQRERLNASHVRLNQRLTVFGIIVAVSTLASAVASLFNLGHTSGIRVVILSLVVPLLGIILLLIVFLSWKRSQHAGAGEGDS